MNQVAALLPGQRLDSSVLRRATEARKREARIDARLVELLAELRAERALRIAAERNATTFHALLIAERVKHVSRNTTGSGRTHLDCGRAAGANGGEL